MKSSTFWFMDALLTLRCCSMLMPVKKVKIMSASTSGLGPAIRPGDDPRACRLPLAPASQATGALVLVLRARNGHQRRANRVIGNETFVLIQIAQSMSNPKLRSTATQKETAQASTKILHLPFPKKVKTILATKTQNATRPTNVQIPGDGNIP